MTQQEQDAAILRAEIRWAGRSVRFQRVLAGIVLTGAFGYPMLGMPLAFLAEAVGAHSPLAAALMPRPEVVAVLALLSAAGAIGLTAAASSADRRSRRDLYRRHLAVLSPTQQAEVLLPLRSDRSRDTRAITNALVREFRLPTELTPSAAPEGRGDEGSPAG